MDDVLLNKAAIMERCLRRVAEEYAGTPSRLLDPTHQDAIVLNSGTGAGLRGLLLPGSGPGPRGTPSPASRGRGLRAEERYRAACQKA